MSDQTVADLFSQMVVKGEKGEPGPEGLRGPEGPKGDKGDKGEDGLDGLDGRDGKDGAPGETGPRGPQGERGPKGERGEKGLKGDKGDVGPEGKTGPPGPSGTAGAAGANSDTRMRVRHNGAFLGRTNNIDFAGSGVSVEKTGDVTTVEVPGISDDVEEALDEAANSLPYNVKSYGAVGDGVATDEDVAIQLALDAARTARGGHVFVPEGTYLITDHLRIASNTKLELAPGATIKRNAAIEYMLQSWGSDPMEVTPGTGYTGQSNVEICGGTWDANLAGFASNVNILTPSHGRYWNIHDTTLKNAYGWHHLELQAMQHVVVRNVTFLDFDASTSGKEMLQFDKGADSTPCDDILVEGCFFINGARGLGSHSSAGHTRLRIIGNHFETMRESGVEIFSSSSVLVEGNTFKDCITGINVETDGATVRRNISIVGNVVLMPSSGSATAGIRLNGGSSSRRVADVTISGNTVRGAAATGVVGIHTAWAQNVVVQGNVVHSTTSDGIRIDRCINVQVTGNQARSNASTGTAGTSDITVKGSAATDCQDVVVSDNGCDKMYLGPYGDRYLVTDNIIATSYTVDGTNAPTNIERISNFIAGAWVTQKVSSHYPFILFPTGSPWTNMPSALTEFAGGTSRRFQLDLTHATQVRLAGRQGVAAASGSKLRAQYSTDGGGSWNYMDGATGPEMALSTGTDIQTVGSWVTLVAAAKADVLVRMVGLDGDGTADPSWFHLELQARAQ